jgi:hypothetical protein
MATLRIWRHKVSNASYVVAVSAGGELLAAVGPLAYEDPRAAMTADHEPDPEALAQVRRAWGEFLEDYELDEDGRLWDYQLRTPEPVAFAA